MSTRLPIFTANEVAKHNSKEDCWLTIHNKVYDLSSLLAEEGHGALCDPLVNAAGTDISHWFDKETGDIKTFIDPITNMRVPYTPQGRFIHVSAVTPTTVESNDGIYSPWWKNSQYIIGTVTHKARKIRIINSLTGHEHIVEFGVEHTIEDMQRGYLPYNAHCGSYVWKAVVAGKFRPLDVHKTLAENGIPDDSSEFEKLGLDEEDPDMLLTLLLVFTDDLTIA